MNRLKSFFDDLVELLPIILLLLFGVAMILLGAYWHESGKKSTWLQACTTLMEDQVKCELLQALR